LLQGLVYLTLKLVKFTGGKWSKIFTQKIPAMRSPVLSLPKEMQILEQIVKRKNRHAHLWKYHLCECCKTSTLVFNFTYS
jgi:hypothetical protein